MKNLMLRFTIFLLILLLCFAFGCGKKEEAAVTEKPVTDALKLDEIPQVVMDALKAKFPRAEIHKWSQEQEGDIIVYDFEFKQDGQNFEADIKEDGTIHNWEKAIEATDLPEAVMKSVKGKYPEATLQEIMEITAVTDGMDALEGYEIVLKTADMKDVEVTIAPDGEILEDSGEMKPQEE
jgi:uncharacterized membrane protein YkoI